MSNGLVLAYVPPDEFDDVELDVGEEGVGLGKGKGNGKITVKGEDGVSVVENVFRSANLARHLPSVGVEMDPLSLMGGYEDGENDGVGVGVGPNASSIASSGLSNLKYSDSNNNSSNITNMTLDAIALSNLEILVNNSDHSSRGSLLSFIDRTKTPFGRRMLKEWLCRPLYRPKDIAVRARAVEELISGDGEGGNGLGSEEEEEGGGGGGREGGGDMIRERVLPILKTLPDLERLLARVHSNGLRCKGTPVGGAGGMFSKKKGDSNKAALELHPDSRAVMYETPIYNARKIKDFVDVLTGFES